MTGSQAAWWAALGAGLVVALVAGVLLETLRRSVHRVRQAVDDVLATGGRLAQNTWTVQLLGTTRRHGASLLEELRLRQGERSGG